MRRVLYLGCSLALLFQISCGGTVTESSSTDSSKSVKMPPIKVADLNPGQGVKKKKDNSKGSRFAKQFFSKKDPYTPIKKPFPKEDIEKVQIPQIGEQGNGQPTQKKSNGQQPNQGKKKDEEFKIKIPSKKGMKTIAPAQPNYSFVKNGRIGGKTIEEWIREIYDKKEPDRNSDPSKIENAIRTVLMFGPKEGQKAVPAICNRLHQHNKYKFTKPLDASIRVNGAIALGILLSEENKSEQRLINGGVYQLSKLLRDPQVFVKYKAASALARIGRRAVTAEPEGPSVIPNLIDCLRDKSTWEIRQAAALALGRVGLDNKIGPDLKALSALYGSIKVDSASQVRLAAIQSLAYLGTPENRQHQTVLKQKLDEVANADPDGTVRIWAHIIVMNITEKFDGDRIRLISRHLQSEEVIVRVQSAKALWALGLKAKSELRTLIGALDDQDEGVVFWCMNAIGAMGRWGEQDAAPKLQEIAKNMKLHLTIRQTAEETLRIVQGKAAIKDNMQKKSKEKDTKAIQNSN